MTQTAKTDDETSSEASRTDDVNDVWGPRALTRIFREDLSPLDSVDYLEFHVIRSHDGTGNGPEYRVQLEGHTGSVFGFDPDEFTDVFDLIARLNREREHIQMLRQNGGLDAVVEYAGQRMTTDPNRAEGENYILMPESIPEA